MLIEEASKLGRYDSIFLSPHLDDVALSCPGSLMTDRAEGRRALVATVFTDGNHYEDRLEEDRHAMRILRCDHTWCGLPDAPFRSQLYRSFHGIVFARDASDDATCARIRELLADLIERTQATLLHAPLAVGRHIDHRLCHEAARGSTIETLFYEDRPYTFVRGAVELRLAELGKADITHCPPQEELLSSLFEAAYVRSFLHGDTARRECVDSYQRIWARCAAAPREIAGSSAEATLRSWPCAVLSRSREVLSSYASQIDEVLGSLGSYEAACRLQARLLDHEGSYVERSWRLRD